MRLNINFATLYTTLIATLTIIAIAVGCTSKPQYRIINGYAQGTTYSITYKHTQPIDNEVNVILDEFDNSLSNFNKNSLLSKLNRNTDATLDDYFLKCMEISQVAYLQTDKLFDPTLRPVIEAYGFGSKYTGTPNILTDNQLDSLRHLIGLHKIQINEGRLIKENPSMSIDFSAVAQGLSVDVMAAEMEKIGIENYLVEIGGEIFARGVNPKGKTWRVGIDAPIEGNNTKGEELIKTVELQAKGLATSGNYRKFIDTKDGVKYTHTVNPVTLKCTPSDLLSVTVIAQSAAFADAYATAAMVGGKVWSEEFFKKLENASAFIIFANDNGQLQTKFVE